MENYDVAPLNTRAMRLSPIMDESDVDGMSTSQMAVDRGVEGSE